MFTRYDVNARNKQGVSLFFTVRNWSEYLSESWSDNDNIVKIFFHPLMVFLSGHLYYQNHEDSVLKAESKVSFPYIDRHFFIFPQQFVVKSKKSSKVGRLPLGLINVFLRLLFCLSPNKKSGVVVELNVYSKYAISRVSIILGLLLEGVLPVLVRGAAPNLSGLDLQLDYLKDALADWFAKEGIEQGKQRAEHFCNAALQILDMAHKCDAKINGKPKNDRATIFLSSSHADITERLNAVQARAAGKLVLQLGHGLVNSKAIDEPIFGYSERSFCDAEITYGEIQNTHLFLNVPITSGAISVARSSSEILKTLKRSSARSKIKSKELIMGARALYVPTSIDGNFTYLPYRSVSDKTYLWWHKELKKQLPNLAVKPHPKQKALFVSNFKEVEVEPLLAVSERYEVIIFDYLSTAFAEIAATTKPIIFVDIGTRNLSESALSSIRRRCYYIDNRNFDVDIRAELAAIGNLSCKDRHSFSRKFSVKESDLNLARIPSDGRLLAKSVAEYIVGL